MSEFMYSLSMAGLIGVIMLASLVGALFGLFVAKILQRHWVILRDLHRDETFYGASSILFALLLAFITIVVWESYQATVDAIENEASTLDNLYQDLDALPAAERDRFHGLIRHYVDRVVHEEWDAAAQGKNDIEAMRRLGAVSLAILRFEPTTESDKILIHVLRDGLNQYRMYRSQRLMAKSPSIDILMWSVLLAATGIYILHGCLIKVVHIHAHAVQMVLIALTTGLVFVILVAYDRPFARPLDLRPEVFVNLLELWDGKAAEGRTANPRGSRPDLAG